MSSGPEPREFRQRLLGWFDENARDLPWRRSRDPYAIWVSEIMLQQTRVAAVLEHYSRFMERFPTLEALAAASEDEVLAHWSGLGYYRRARLLHKAAQFVAQKLGGRLPSKAADLRALPGVGEYTCAAIASIGFGEAIACVDGNVERVLRRIRGWDESQGTAAKVRAEAARLLDVERAGDFNQAMMELGATMCLPRGPLCEGCAVRELCATRGEHPVAERKKMRSKQSAYAIVRRSRKTRAAEVLLERRPSTEALMPGLWELPAIEMAHAPEEKKALTVRHSITDTNYYVSVYEVGSKHRKVLPKRKAVRRWFPLSELNTVPLTGLARKVLKRLRAWPGYEGAGPTAIIAETKLEVLVPQA
jgi:A/G-specific adenine glycosylase